MEGEGMEDERMGNERMGDGGRGVEMVDKRKDGEKRKQRGPSTSCRSQETSQ